MLYLYYTWGPEASALFNGKQVQIENERIRRSYFNYSARVETAAS